MFYALDLNCKFTKIGVPYLVTTDKLLTERFLLTAFRCRLRAGRAAPVLQSLLSEPSTLHVTPGGV